MKLKNIERKITEITITVTEDELTTIVSSLNKQHKDNIEWAQDNGFDFLSSDEEYKLWTHLRDILVEKVKGEGGVR